MHTLKDIYFLNHVSVFFPFMAPWLAKLGFKFFPHDTKELFTDLTKRAMAQRSADDKVCAL